MTETARAARRVGFLLFAAIAVAALAILLIGERRNLFVRKRAYVIQFPSVSGLQTGSTVQLDGVAVGSVDRVTLPEDVGRNEIDVRILVDARFVRRVRADSMARIRTLGLLGDKYIEISTGSASFPEVPEGGEISTAPVTDVEQLRASGEDVINNIARITEQLTTILGRMERGEGLLGELSKDVEPGRRVTTEFLGTLDSVRALADEIRGGPGPLPRLLHDPVLGAQLEGTVQRLDRLLAQAEAGEGALALLLTDGAAKSRLERSLENLDRATADVAETARSLRASEALLPRLLNDEEYGKELATELKTMVENLARVAEKLDHGPGSAAQAINDPELYQAMKDIVSGVNESKILKRLLRNRQKAGAEKRLREQVESAPPPGKAP